MNRKRVLYPAMGLLAALVIGFSSNAKADDKVDPVHSFVVFDIHHFGAGYVYGTFAGPTGTVVYDDSDPSKASFDVTVDASTLDTRVDRRNQDLKGPDFFDVKQFPTMNFKSTASKKTGDKTFDVTGDLTLHGVTKSITVPMEMTGSGPGMHNEIREGFRTTFSIKRSDFGMNYDAPMIGDEVSITVALEAIKQ